MTKMNKQNTLPATVTKISHDGRGIAIIDGKTTFLRGGLVGETVKFYYKKKHSQYDEGVVSEIVIPSSNRVTPSCAHYSICGGCSGQHMSCETQLEWKQSAFLELLRQTANILPEHLFSPITGLNFGYRRKARLGIKYLIKYNKMVVGFREHQSRYITDLKSCAILHPSVGENIEPLNQMLNKLAARQQIPQIEIAVDDIDAALIIRHLQKLCDKDQSLLRKFADTHHYKLYLQPKGLDSIYLDYPKEASENMQYTLPDYGLTITFKPWQFTQINHDINQRMIQQALKWLALKKEDHVLDLFCGVGNFTLPLAQFCHHITGVEGDLSAVKQATYNAERNHCNNADFYCANLFESIIDHSWAKQFFNKIIIDPPRSGAKEILEKIPWQPERIVYVSCNPATFARDAKLLHDQKYTLMYAQMLDMFPHTQHMEVIALFTKS